MPLASDEGDYTVKYAQRKTGSEDAEWGDSFTQIKIRSFKDICNPQMAVEGEFEEEEFEYYISSETLNIPLPDFESNDC